MWDIADNVYTLCDSEVVSKDRNNAALVGFAAHRTVGSFTDVASGISVRDYIAETSLCFCLAGNPLLV